MAAVEVKVPSAGESVTEGILSRWLKPDGSQIKSGEPLFEVETDKATTDVPAPADGVLKISVPEGETVEVGATVATIDPSGSPSAAEKTEAPKAEAPKSKAEPASPACAPVIAQPGPDRRWQRTNGGRAVAVGSKAGRGGKGRPGQG